MSALLLSDQHARMLANGKANAERMADDGNTQGALQCIIKSQRLGFNASMKH